MSAGLRIVGATKRFGAVQALAGVSLEAAPGEFVVLLGPSGSGKTTLLRAIAGLEPLDAGQIWIGDTLLEDAGAKLRVPSEMRGLGMVFQEYALWPHLSALENVGLPLRERRIADWKARATQALESVGLHVHAARFPFELSGGQQQRVALARALAGRPQVLLFDEPLSNLDAQLREELRLEIARLTREYAITSVYITHDQSEAFFLADQLGVMSAGCLLQFAPPETIYEAPSTAFVARFTGAMGPIPARRLEGQVSFEALNFEALHGDLEVYLRPEDLTLSEQPIPDALEATVEHSAYIGGRYQCWLAAAVGGRLLAWHSQRLQPQQRVWIAVQSQQMHVFDLGTGRHVDSSKLKSDEVNVWN